MNKIFSVVVFFVFSNVFFLFGQNDSINEKQNYDHWARRGIVQVTYAYMLDDSLKRKIEDSERNSLRTFKEKYIENVQDYENIQLDSISVFLDNNSYSKTNQNIFSKLLERYRNNNSLNKDFFKLKNIDSTYNNFNTKSQFIITNYNKKLVSSKTENDLKLDTGKDQSLERDNISPSYSYDTLFIILYFFIGFIVGYFALLFYTTNKVKSIIGDDYKVYVIASGRPFMFSFLSAISYLQERKVDYKKEKIRLDNNLKNTREEYESNIDDLNKKLEESNKDFNSTESKVGEEKPVNFKEDATSEPVILSHKNDSKSKNLYFTIPEQDGSFVISNGSESNDGRKYFKISFDESSSKGLITYISSQRDGRAINRLDTNLKPVCDIVNISDASSASKIEILEKGDVLLQGDKWVIDSNNKIKIRLV